MSTVPAVLTGERAVEGWSPRAVAELLGVPYAEPERLLPALLLERLDRILAGAQRAIRQVPVEKLELKSPDRDRPVRQLGYHVFRLSAAFVDGVEQNQYPYEWLVEPVPPELGDGEAIARYGERVRSRLREWRARAESAVYARPVTTYYGAQTVHELLERTTWHAAQHLRQLYAFLGMMDVQPDEPLGDEDFKGLPLPEALW
ncbi:MAG: DinB family protein [Candidatus Methylomirabilia bacterium]